MTLHGSVKAPSSSRSATCLTFKGCVVKGFLLLEEALRLPALRPRGSQLNFKVEGLPAVGVRGSVAERRPLPEALPASAFKVQAWQAVSCTCRAHDPSEHCLHIPLFHS